MSQIVSFTALFFVVGLASAAEVAEADLTKYKIQTVEIAMPPRLKELYGWMREYHLLNNVLQFEWFKSEIYVARSASMRPLADRGLELVGFDPESLKIQWLDPGRLIWLKWGTFPHGQGRYSKQGHLILQLDGEKVKELFRDSIYAYGRGGLLDSSQVDLNIRYDSSIPGLSLVRTEVQRGSSDKKGLFEDHEWTTDQGNTIYFGESRTRTVWRYRIENGQLRFVSGERYADLPKACSVLDLAEAFRVPAAKLRRLNPKLKSTDHTSGTLIVDAMIGPYAHEKDDGICGDKPCPRE